MLKQLISRFIRLFGQPVYFRMLGVRDTLINLVQCQGILIGDVALEEIFLLLLGC